MSITAVIITKNEQEMIRDCILSLSFADEILVIDSGSTDQTVSLAKELKARIISVRFSSFSDVRNIALVHVNTTWVLYIDADERVSPELGIEIKNVSESHDYSAYSFTRCNYFLGSKWPKNETVIRLFQVKKFKGWYGNVHESPKFHGTLGILTNELRHFTHRNLSAMVDKTNQWSFVEAELFFKANHPTMSEWRFFRVMLTKFFDYYLIQSGWKSGIRGLIESMYQSFSVFITYAKLWEMQSEEKK